MEQPLIVPIVEIPLAAAFTNDEQSRYERFRKIDPLQFQGGNIEDAHKYFTTCRVLLETKGLTQTNRVWNTLQLHGPARE